MKIVHFFFQLFQLLSKRHRKREDYPSICAISRAFTISRAFVSGAEISQSELQPVCTYKLKELYPNMYRFEITSP